MTGTFFPLDMYPRKDGYCLEIPQPYLQCYFSFNHHLTMGCRWGTAKVNLSWATVSSPLVLDSISANWSHDPGHVHWRHARSNR